MIDITVLKNYLDVTYDDEDNDKKLIGILNRATAEIRELCAVPEGAELSDSEEQLLLDCCRYIRANALEDFPVNFGTSILGLRFKRLGEVARETAETEEAEGGD